MLTTMEANPPRTAPPVTVTMQPTSFPVAPTTPDKDSVIFDLLGDGYAEAIIVATIPAPRSALDLVQSLGIPTAACYRRLAELCDIGLLAVEGFGHGMK